MPIQSIEPRRLYRQIADQLRGLIAGGEFALGERLPAERDLAAQLGVSRPSVREALIALEVEGLVEVRVGSGIYVCAREAPASARRVENAFGPFEIIRARQVVECELAAAAAGTMNAAQVRGLREALVLMREDIERGEVPLRGDRQFHVRIAEAAENAPLLRIVAALFDERHNPLFAQLGAHFENEPSWRAAVAEHEAVIAAIAAKDAARARKAMHTHLQRSHDRFMEPPRSLRSLPPEGAATRTGKPGSGLREPPRSLRSLPPEGVATRTGKPGSGLQEPPRSLRSLPPEGVATRTGKAGSGLLRRLDALEGVR